MISFDDHYSGSDFNYWGRALIDIAEHFGEYVNLSMGWHESFDDGLTPIDAFFSEYPEYKSQYESEGQSNRQGG